MPRKRAPKAPATPKKRKRTAAKADPLPKRKRGGQTRYTDAIADEILERMSRGETLRAICSEDRMPAASTVSMWSINDEPPGFAERYARARQDQANSLAEEALQIADACEDAAKARLQVDTRKWLASKINPAKFGDKTQLEHSGSGGGPIDFSFVIEHAGDGDNPGE